MFYPRPTSGTEIPPIKYVAMRDNMLQLQDFIQQHGCSPHEWYVGITSSPEQVLFTDFKVHRGVDSWMYRMADSEATARIVYELLVEMGCNRAKAPEEPQGTVVYAFLRSGDSEFKTSAQ